MVMVAKEAIWPIFTLLKLRPLRFVVIL